LADNRSAELAEWDQTVLASQLVELDVAGWDLAGLGFDVPEPESESDDENESLAFDDDEPIVSKVGDIWQVGPHRIACGDSTDKTMLTRLTQDLEVKAIITDPPYGISIVQNNKVGSNKLAKAATYRTVIGDENSDIAAVSFNLAQTMFSKTTQCWWGGNHYTGKAQLPDSSCWLVWDKQTGDNNFADAELAWTNHKGAVRIFKHLWAGMLRASERGARVRIHPTQKPTALTQWVIETLRVEKGSVVLDLFAGSGSTLVGAADSGCIGVGIELDPFYVDKIVQRLEKQTGQTAQLIND
jgi:DNA modification methylase